MHRGRTSCLTFTKRKFEVCWSRVWLQFYFCLTLWLSGYLQIVQNGKKDPCHISRGPRIIQQYSLFSSSRFQAVHIETLVTNDIVLPSSSTSTRERTQQGLLQSSASKNSMPEPEVYSLKSSSYLPLVSRCNRLVPAIGRCR